MMRWILPVTVPLAIGFVWIAGHMVVTSIYYRGKSDGWVRGFDACEGIRENPPKPAATLGMVGDSVEWYSIDGHCIGNCPEWSRRPSDRPE